MKIGVTGHQVISNPKNWSWVESKILEELTCYSNVTGISSLAIGADQVFAECVLKLKGELEIIIPFPEYERTFLKDEHIQRYNSILSKAKKVNILPSLKDEQESYLAAGKLVVDSSNLIVAIWDGNPAKGKGGTGDAVQYALKSRKNVIHINPDSMLVSRLLSNR